MIKKTALFLASTALAGVLVCSTPTALNTGGFEALTAKKFTDNPEWFDGYNFFGDSIVETTITYRADDIDLDFDETLRLSFGNWTPQYQYGYTNLDGRYKIDFSDGENDIDVSTIPLGTTEIADPYYLEEYKRMFTALGCYDDGIDSYEFNPNSWSVYKDKPFIVPLAFLRQFVLGLYLSTQGDIKSFDGSMRVYDFYENEFDNRSVSLRSGSEISYNLMNSISPSSFDSIFADPRYIYDNSNPPSNADSLYYNGDWVFVSFNFTWHTDDTEINELAYQNEYITQSVFDILEISAYQLSGDTRNLWNRFYGDSVYLEQVNPPDLIFGTVESFLSTEFMPDFSFGDLLLIVLGVMVFGAFLKVFLGG